MRIAAVVAALVVAAGCTGGSGEEPDVGGTVQEADGGAGSSGSSVLGDDEAGPDPFAPVDGGRAPAELAPLISQSRGAAEEASAAVDPDDEGAERELLQTRLDAAVAVFTDAGEPLIRPRSVAGAAVAPARDEAACESPDLVFRLEEAGAVEAFAGVVGVEPDDLVGHLDELTPGYLIADALVVNHRFRAGGAVPFRSILAAGSAVLVDGDGLPRVRCRSAAPLLPAWIELDELILPSTAFADRVEDAHIGADVPAEPFSSVDGVFTDQPEDALGPPDGVAVSLGDDPTATSATGGATTTAAADEQDTTSSIDDEDSTTTGGEAGTASCRNRIVLELVDNRLVDGPGDDLLVVELGRPETTFVAVGVTADELRPVGSVPGGTASIDVSAVAEADDEFAFVQLCDGPDLSSEVAGSDIDAVAALHSVDPRN